jgi:hypothetical protein
MQTIYSKSSIIKNIIYANKTIFKQNYIQTIYLKNNICKQNIQKTKQYIHNTIYTKYNTKKKEYIKKTIQYANNMQTICYPGSQHGRKHSCVQSQKSFRLNDFYQGIKDIQILIFSEFYFIFFGF